MSKAGCAFMVACLAALQQTSGLQITGASQSDSECAACQLVARNLEAETHGAPIHSELRRMEVLERLCKDLDGYVGSASGGVVKYKKPKKDKDGKPVLDLGGGGSGGALDLNSLFGGGGGMEALQAQMADMVGPKQDEKTKELKSYCASMVEANEDELSELIGRGSSNVHEAVCVQTTSKCSSAQVQAYLEDAAAHPEDHASSPPPATPPPASKKTGTPSSSKKKKKKKKAKKAGGKEEL